MNKINNRTLASFEDKWTRFNHFDLSNAETRKAFDKYLAVSPFGLLSGSNDFGFVDSVLHHMRGTASAARSCTVCTNALNLFDTPFEHCFTRTKINKMRRDAKLVVMQFSEDAPCWCVDGMKA